MANHGKTHWRIELHTKIKHLILRRYLQAWLPIMAKHNGRILFIDGFAGPGRYVGGEEGSPLIALRALLEHPHFRKAEHGREFVFVFIESHEARANALTQELNRMTADQPLPAWIKYQVLHGEFEPLITNLLDRLDREGKRLAPTFASIDPFGFAGVPIRVIARIVQNPHCECLITFMYESINRFLSHPDVSVWSHFDELFGTSEWRPLAELSDPEQRRDQIANLYQRQLVEKGRLRYVRTFEMINRGNRTEYFLCFGTNNLQGLSKMKQAMWKADPIRGQVFSDRTDTNQVVLFKPSPDLTVLRNLLQEQFQNLGWVGIERVEQFVLQQTPFSEAIHLKRLTLAPIERAGLIEVRRPSGTRNRPGDYPPGTRIRVQ